MISVFRNIYKKICKFNPLSLQLMDFIGKYDFYIQYKDDNNSIKELNEFNILPDVNIDLKKLNMIFSKITQRE